MSTSSKIITTPLGNLQFDVVDETGIPLTSGFSLRKLSIEPILPTGMAVNEVMAVLLTLTPQVELTKIIFSCSWVEPLSVQGDPESGEWIDAQSWQVGKHIVMVGTEDFDLLSARLPECNFRDKEDYPVEYLPYGMHLHIPKVVPGNPTTFHFIIASNQFPEPREYSAWYAIDIRNWEVVEMAATSMLAETS